MNLGGLVVPVPTLFGDDGALDTGRNSKFARTLSERRVDHLFVLGSLGEFPSVGNEERARLIDTVVESATGATDVWVGVGAPSTAEAVRFADQAESLGAAALVAVPPYYLRPTEAAVERYYRDLAEEVSVPLLAYNIPSLVGYALSPDLVHRLAHDGILAGLKDTTDSFGSLTAFLEGKPDDFAVLPGNDRFASGGVGQGAAGAVMGLANLVPALCVRLLRDVRAGDAEKAAEEQRLVDALAAVVDAGPFPSTVKFLAARLRNAEVGYRAPYGPLTSVEEARVLERLRPLETEIAPYLAEGP